MKNFKPSPGRSMGFVEKKEILEKKPEDVIGFLREFNFGNRDESARVAVDRFLFYIEGRGDEDLLLNESSLVDLIVEEFEKAGFVEPGTISHEKWTKQAKLALLVALNDFNNREKKWQTEVSKKHQDWRV